MLPHDQCEDRIPPKPEGQDDGPVLVGSHFDPTDHHGFFDHPDAMTYFAPPSHPQTSTIRPGPVPSSQATRSQEDVFGELMSLAYLDPQHQPRDGGDPLRYPWVVPPYDRPPTTEYGNIYLMEVVQQPQRARMCGFGDKDRRPITPPPIIKLTVTTNEGYPLQVSDLDVSFYVVLCDVWTADASTKVNLVIHPSEAPMLTPGNSSAAAAAMSSAASSSHSPPTIAVAGTKLNPDANPTGTNNDTPSPAATRNLIGSLVSSAAKLFDTEDQLGIYFVFQDLSIRTEGTFRLGFSLVDVGSPYLQGINEAPSRVLAQTFSDPFTVFSAKKFPGMIESTPLSRAFARQGVKIPIRKDAAKGKKGEPAEEDDDE